MQAGRELSEVIKVEEKTHQHGVLYTEKLSLNCEREIKTFADK